MEKRFLTPVEAYGAIIQGGRRIMGQSILHAFILSLLAGFYIAFGAQLSTLVSHDAQQFAGLGMTRFMAGSVFSIGLMLVVVCGAELFTGNTLLVASGMHGEVSWSKVAENWLVVLTGNFIGALFFAWLMYESRLWETGTVAEQAVRVAAAKCRLPFWVAFIRGILCNWLVCLAVFMAHAARDIPGKMLACYVPIMTFVTSGFEHSIANMYFIPTGLLIASELGRAEPSLNWLSFVAANLVPVTLGNIFGGVVFVVFAYRYTHGKQ